MTNEQFIKLVEAGNQVIGKISKVDRPVYDVFWYERGVARTYNAVSENSYPMALACTALGLTGEAGEIAEKIKKHLCHGHDLDINDMALECGDLMWYLARMIDLLGFTIEDVMTANLGKLALRYPNGFNHEDSKNRSL